MSSPNPEVEDTYTRTIEVTALFEESVVEVRHLGDPRTGRTSTRTRVELAVGTSALAVTLLTFVYAYLHHDGRVPVALDAVAVLAFALAAGGLAHGLQRWFAERAPTGFDIPGGLVTSHSDGVRFPLVRSTGREHQLMFTPEMRGEVTLDGATLTLADLTARNLAHPSGELPLASAWTIREGARICVTLGENTWLVASVPAPRRVHLPTLIDWRAQSYTAFAGLAAALFLAGIFSVPPDPHSLSVDDFLRNNRFPTFVIKAPLEEDQKIPAWLTKGDGPKGDDGGGKALGKSGQMGKPGAPKEPKRYAIKGPANNRDITLAKTMAYDRAISSGVLGIMRATNTSQIGAVWSPSETALGHDAETIMGGLIGTETGESNGVPNGLGAKGDGDGGGGHSKTIGMSDLPTIGHDGKKPGWFNNNKIASLNDHKKHEKIEPFIGPTTVRGGIDKEIVRRIIRRHLNEVKFCYEKELMKNQDLFGRVVTDFTIAGNGVVISSVVQSSTLGNVPVEQCIAGAVKRWEFPKPDGGGLVMVSYPFVLKSATPN